MTFQQFTDKQLMELIARRSPHHLNPITRHELQLFLQGDLEPRKQVFRMRKLRQRMHGANLHLMTNNGDHSMDRKEYLNLWPKQVTLPPRYAGRFSHLLPVDTTIPLELLINCLGVETHLEVETLVCQSQITRLQGSSDLVDPPARYLTFINVEHNDNWRCANDFVTQAPSDQPGLSVHELLFCVMFYPAILSEFDLITAQVTNPDPMNKSIYLERSAGGRLHLRHIMSGNSVDDDKVFASRADEVVQVTA